MQCSASTWVGPTVNRVANGSLGRPPLPLRKFYVPAVLELLLIGACGLQTEGQIHSSTPENKVSVLLDRHMRAARIANNTSDIISWSMRPSIPVDPEGSSDLAEPDFLFTWGPYPSRADPSLFVEAKRLRGTGPSLAGDYVDEGVMRFVEGSYGRGHDYGIMMGYVMVAPISSAISRVRVAMESRKCKTEQLSGFVPDNSLCTYPDTHHSTHLQQVTIEPITLVHTFMDFSTDRNLHSRKLRRNSHT